MQRAAPKPTTPSRALTYWQRFALAAAEVRVLAELKKQRWARLAWYCYWTAYKNSKQLKKLQRIADAMCRRWKIECKPIIA
jgi:hypothetical protein